MIVLNVKFVVLSYLIKLVQLFAYDTVKKHLTPKLGEQPIQPIPASLIAGAVAGISSTVCTYPLELLKTRLTVQVKEIQGTIKMSCLKNELCSHNCYLPVHILAEGCL